MKSIRSQVVRVLGLKRLLSGAALLALFSCALAQAGNVPLNTTPAYVDLHRVNLSTNSDGSLQLRGVLIPRMLNGTSLGGKVIKTNDALFAGILGTNYPPQKAVVVGAIQLSCSNQVALLWDAAWNVSIVIPLGAGASTNLSAAALSAQGANVPLLQALPALVISNYYLP